MLTMERVNKYSKTEACLTCRYRALDPTREDEHPFVPIGWDGRE